ncbi:Semaphorin-5B [Microtus ochrogaster]|uniref:Semaphorin-5B n=1 Tax=Microtus ochrogaster TaxID=79684 RepID=A0A8J6KNQ5_MICOH|nr:Semaphorin-5B [Microtus ochrogaster]
MVVPGPLAVSLLLPSLSLLVSQLSSSQDISSELNSEQQLCAQKEHPIVAFEGTTSSDSALPMFPSFRTSDPVLGVDCGELLSSIRRLK